MDQDSSGIRLRIPYAIVAVVCISSALWLFWFLHGYFISERVDIIVLGLVVMGFCAGCYYASISWRKHFHETDFLRLRAEASLKDCEKELSRRAPLILPKKIEMKRLETNFEKNDELASLSIPGRTIKTEVTINSQTLDNLKRAVADFPSRYPDYKTRPPKLDDDVRPWLKSSGYAKNEREAHAWGVILAEHFGF